MKARTSEAGFSLIELSVVLFTLAVLAAVAAPTFLAARNRAADRSAQLTGRLAVQTARGAVVEDGTYAVLTPGRLAANEPLLGFVDASLPSTGPGIVSMETPDRGLDGKVVVFAVWSNSRTCFFARDVRDDHVWYATVKGVDDEWCKAGQYAALGPGDWRRTW